jgi:predicted extracellular nuclease
VARRKKLGCSLPLIAAVMLAVAADRLLGEQDTPPAAAKPEVHVVEPAPEPNTTPAAKPVRSPFPPGSPWESRDACEAALAKTKRAGTPVPRIGTWNLAWFPAGTADGTDPQRQHDVPWMACIIAVLQVQVLAVQEVVHNPAGRAALLDLLAAISAHTGGHWRSVLDDCKDDGRQHVGFLYDEARVALLSSRMLAELNPLRSACDGRLRPGLAAHFRYRKHGPDFSAVSVHLDSGVLARDYEHRKTSVARLDAALRALAIAHKEQDLLVLGDFNTMGCSACKPKVTSEEEIAAFEATLDAFSPSLRSLMPEQGCSHYYRGRGGRLDHVLAPRGMKELGSAPHVRAHGLCEAASCERTPSAAKLPATLRLSDHCPVVVTLRAEDAD